MFIEKSGKPYPDDKNLLSAPSSYAPSTIMSKHAGCDHKRFIRLRVYSTTPPTADANDNTEIQCVASEESRLWSNQRNISFSFVDPEPGDRDEKDSFYRKKTIVTTAMGEYSKYANVKFILQEPGEDRPPATLRISFDVTGGVWSAVGTDALMLSTAQPTMNLGLLDPGMKLKEDPAKKGDAAKTADDVNYSIALHVIGHALGLAHELDPSDSKLSEAARGHLRHSHGNRGMSNFSKYQSESIMRYFEHSTTADGIVECDVNKQLSDWDKAWLTLHYPKAEVNKPPESGSWVLKNSLGQLGVSAEYSTRILATDDVSERRLLYSLFITSQWAKEKDQRKRVTGSALGVVALGRVKSALDDYNGARQPTPSAEVERFLIQLQANAGPKVAPGRMPDGATPGAVEVQHSIFDLLRLIGFSLPPPVQHALTSERERQERDISMAIFHDLAQASEGNPEIAKLIKDAAEKRKKEDEKRLEESKAAAEAQLDGLFSHIEHSVQRDSDMGAADIQHFFHLLPSALGVVGKVIGMLGFSINTNGSVDPPDDVQHGIFDNIPWMKIAKKGLEMGAGLLG